MSCEIWPSPRTTTFYTAGGPSSSFPTSPSIEWPFGGGCIVYAWKHCRTSAISGAMWLDIANCTGICATGFIARMQFHTCSTVASKKRVTGVFTCNAFVASSKELLIPIDFEGLSDNVFYLRLIFIAIWNGRSVWKDGTLLTAAVARLNDRFELDPI